jgi:uncharacterized repeat protein (TIGR01451 family)
LVLLLAILLLSLFLLGSSRETRAKPTVQQAQSATKGTNSDCPDLTITKSHYPDPIVGGVLSYAIAFSNIGTSEATGVVITDTLPPGVTYQSASIPPSDFIRTANTLIWRDLDTLHAGATGTIAITTTVSHLARGGDLLCNEVSIACDQGAKDEFEECTPVYPFLIRIAPTETLSTASPGQRVCYMHTVHLTGTQAYTASMAATSSDGWVTEIAPLSVHLEPGDSKEITGCVRVPTDCAAVRGTTDTLTVTASLVNGPGYTVTARDMTTMAALLVQVQIEPDITRTAQASETISFIHTVTNGGNCTDTISISAISSQGWPVDWAPKSPLTLAPGKSREVVVTVTVPSSATNMTDIVTTTATSGLDLLKKDTAIDVITAEVYEVYLPLALRNFSPLCNGGFEGGWACWEHGGELRQRIVKIHNGQALLLGDPAYDNRGIPEGSARAWQTFTVPYDTPAVTIEYHIYTHDLIWSDNSRKYFDSFEIYIDIVDWKEAKRSQSRDPWRKTRCRDEKGIPDTSAAGLVFCDGNASKPSGSGPPKDLGWRSVTLDLSPFQGQNTTLYIAVFNRVDGWYNTWAYVDDVRANW